MPTDRNTQGTRPCRALTAKKRESTSATPTPTTIRATASPSFPAPPAQLGGKGYGAA
jgi:hypothetical protein